MADLTSLAELGTATGNTNTQPAAPVYVQKLDKQGRAYATGKRKDAIARVWVKPGSGKIVVNDKEYVSYFARPVLQMILKQRSLREQLERRPTEVIRKAVKGMLPKNKLANQQITKLKIYAGPDHPHDAQAPKPF
jgi:hypothetical protein